MTEQRTACLVGNCEEKLFKEIFWVRLCSLYDNSLLTIDGTASARHFQHCVLGELKDQVPVNTNQRYLLDARLCTV